MTEIGRKSFELLASRGRGVGLELLLSRRGFATAPSGHPLDELFAHERLSGEPPPFAWTMLEFMDAALENVHAHRLGFEPWLDNRLQAVWSTDESAARGALTELEALGTTQQAFPTCLPVSENRQNQTPDFEVPGEFCVEAYCPRTSTTDREDVAAELAAQTGMVKLAISRPLTGSRGASLDYPASKVIDRLLNAKRSSRQYRDGVPNILYVDARREWKLSGKDVLPFRSTYSLGHHWIGTFGVWHAFYGAIGRRSLLCDRVALRFLHAAQVHEQVEEGLFRAAPEWSASIVALTDGIVVFENPWARFLLTKEAIRKSFLLPRMRAELSWYRTDDSADFELDIERMLHRIEWTFREAERDDEAPSGAPSSQR